MSARPYDPVLDSTIVSDLSDGARDDWVWEVRDDETGRVVMSYLERDLRFSVSCKVHVFPTRGEGDAYHGGSRTGRSSRCPHARASLNLAVSF